MQLGTSGVVHSLQNSYLLMPKIGDQTPPGDKTGGGYVEEVLQGGNLL